MKIISSDLQAMAVAPKGYPDDDLFEIAFAGRSNVGKSSLINTLLNRTNLARTSGKPGKTRTINFYLINEKFRFVDLPGYGYAQVSKVERKKWGEIIEKYLKKRGNLKAIVLIVDIRHTPSPQDVDMYKWIKTYGYDAIIAVTKADKISKGQRQKYLNIVKKELQIKPEDKLIAFSSLDKTNRDKLWELLEVYNLDVLEAVE
ncbi:MAG: ribosome biogenesis GTP-binding protein YihA/YsxC [Gudongella sp.]|nr:ribosome biogenesis GTP-binding protein YihA/YsxC [Gudongella sp.]